MKSLLSHHEIAILFLLLDAPNQVAPDNPDAIALQEARLVEIRQVHLVYCHDDVGHAQQRCEIDVAA